VWAGERPGLWAGGIEGSFTGDRPGLPTNEPPPAYTAPEEKGAYAVRLRDAGFRGMKIGGWRAEGLRDAEAIATIRSAVGPDFDLMLDHAGGLGLEPWTPETAVAVAWALEACDAAWLEEPLRLDDFDGLARLAREVDIPIAGGNDLVGLAPFRELLARGSYDILQPDAAIAGGLLATWKIAALAEAHETRCFLHGDSGLALAGWLQLSAALDAEWVEIGIVVPPLLPDEQWRPAMQVLASGSVYDIVDGRIRVPDLPGLGLDLDEDALAELRV